MVKKTRIHSGLAGATPENKDDLESCVRDNGRKAARQGHHYTYQAVPGTPMDIHTVFIKDKTASLLKEKKKRFQY